MDGIFEGKKLLLAEDVADVLGLKPSTLSTWVAQKFIPYIKLGEGKSALVRFSPRRLNQWLEDMSHEPEDEDGHPEKPKKLKQARKKTIDRFNQFSAEI